MLANSHVEHNYRQMRNFFGRIIFKITRKILANLGFSISLGTSGMQYPELTNDEIAFIRDVHSKSLTMTSFDSLAVLALVCKHLESLGMEGDFVEVGVWRGGSSIIAKKFLGKGRKFYLYDTFAGMTKPTEYDFRVGSNDFHSTLSKWENENEGNENKWVLAGLDEVEKNFKEFNLFDEDLIFVKGDVRNTLKQESTPTDILVLRLDTDFYDSTLVELQVLWPKLKSGGILILDDYGHWDGARRAVDEYFAAIGEIDLLKLPICGGGGRILIKN